MEVPARRRALAATLLLLVPALAQAGKIMDFIRSYDLNDYSLGVAVSTSENPYIGTENGQFIYPYLTSFEHSAFTDNWLLLRGENAGLRFVVNDDWEFGLVGRIQTMGQGVADNNELRGINERSWVFEAGPLIGYRGWPVNIQFRSYWEAPNKHSGTTSELEFSLPVQYSRGFFVPALRVAYQSSDYADYYFGITGPESIIGRPLYEPGSATNIGLEMVLGYELSPRWLLKTTVGLEYLDDAVSNSPIINKDQLWSGTVGLAYNADLFNPRDHAGDPDDRPLEIRLGSFTTTIGSTIRRDADDGTPGDEIDLEDVIGAADRQTVFQFDSKLRLGYYHRFQLSYFDLKRDSTKTLENDIDFGEELLPAGTEIRTNIDSSLLRLTYLYSILRDGQKEAGVSAGLSFFNFETVIGELGAEERESLRAEAPLPTLGIFGSAGLGQNWTINADISGFALDFDRYDGYMAYASISAERAFGQTFSAGLGYDLFGMRLESKDDDLGGKLDLVYHGPRLYMMLAF